MEVLKFLDFDLEIEAARTDGLCALSVRSPGGEAEGLLDPGLLPEELRGTVITPPATLQEARTLGGALFEAVFQDDIASRFQVSRQLAEAQQAGLRIRLRLGAPELRALPWELLFDARKDEFVALSRETPLVRYLPLAAPQERLTVQPPLRILALTASPADLAPVDMAQEKERLDAAVARLRAKGRVEVVWLEQQSWRSLQEAMQSGPWHIFHYVGHARFNAAEENGELLLVGEDGRSAPIGAAQLGSLLEDHQSLRLALLNACEGARSDEAQPFSSVAAALVRTGLPAVLAMQYEISAGQASEFTQGFYTALASNLPVDAAVAEARKAMSLAAPASVEWATPVLFMRSPDGVLFETLPARSKLVTYLLAGGVSALLLVILWLLAYWFLIPRLFPTQMAGDFRIAVAGIGSLNPDGKMRQSDFGDDLSLSIFHQLIADYDAAEETRAFEGDVSIWHDSLGRSVKNVAFGLMDGMSPEERSSEAQVLADRIAADMVIYGYLTPGPLGEKLEIEFYYAAPVRAGEPEATAGTQRFRAPITSSVPFDVDPTLARAQMRDPVAQRTRALFWITQALVYQLADNPQRALEVLDEAELQLVSWPESQGKELLYLFRGQSAFLARQYGVALAALDEAQRIHQRYAGKEYVNALIVRGAVLMDQAQLFYARGRTLSPEEAACTSLDHIENSSPTAEDALANIRASIEVLEEAVALAPDSDTPSLENHALMNLGLAYRLLGQALLFRGEYTDADAALENAAVQFDEALARFSPEEQPQYVGWTQVGMGVTRRLQAAIRAVEEVNALNAGDAATAGAKKAEAIGFLQQAIAAYDVCLAQREATQGNPVFQRRILACACEPYSRDAHSALESMGGQP